MNDGRKNCSSSSVREGCEIVTITQSKLKVNRLKRSPRTNQKSHNTDISVGKDFKTPTRVPKLGFRSVRAEESPNNDSELQHEIIWDPTSPATPVRNGRGRRRPAAFKSVEVSDIVNRIAPKNKRSEDAESTLLQWIGDTAVPCTPEIREPRTKPKPARQNLVDDLLKLAKQFDFNMIQQEEAHLKPDAQSSAEGMCEDQDLFFDEDVPPALPQTRSEASKPFLRLEDTKMNASDPPVDPDLVQELDDDLDLLFEGSTQQLSGGLSQGSSTRSQDVVTFSPQLGVKSDSVKNVCGVTRVGGASESSAASVRVASPTASTIKQVGGADDFDDDWNSDYFLDDSLVMEMTQNPELFSAPQCSSTQKQTNRNNIYRQNSDTEAKYRESQRFNQRLNSARGNENVGQSGFNLRSNLKRQVYLSSKDPGSHSVSKTISQPKNPVKNQQQVATASANTTWSSLSVSRSDSPRSVPSATIETARTFRVSKVNKETENHPTVENNVLCDFAAEDLDSIFASDDIWDDGADDLFCEACDKVEESMAEPEPEASVSKQSSRTQSTLNTTSKRESGFITLHNASAPDDDVSMMMSPERIYRLSHVKSTTGSGIATYNRARQVSESTTVTASQSYQRIQDVYQFRKPYNTFKAAPAVSEDVNKAVVTRCSDAEIERKKQQAMERRRLRMLANQNLRAPV
ncbi:ewing's tumor-associated antigen 1 [Tachysurus vachellii]|uniref:ewing's tumor-associated antigen 1 n=1 Tax=Tachysurus vachellii TaxID=175792 RepID=UPI00296B49E3|nr:ewing's tumor-associated antigen 1 [Tachysurus vachellii]